MNDKVIKTKMGKVLRVGFPTANVQVDHLVTHPKYQKKFKVSKKYLVHIPSTNLEPAEGDMVEIVETRPISKRKSWKIVKVLK